MLRHLPPTATPLPLPALMGITSLHPVNLDLFRQALEDYLGVPRCFLASSGRTALYLLLLALKKEADVHRQEVILPAYTCPALAKVILAAGLRPRLVDLSSSVDLPSFDYDRGQLATSIGDETLAVLCVHPFGIPQEIETILALAHGAGAVVIEDAAQSLGAKVAGRPIGRRGDFGLYSLGPGKPFSTGGGGIVSVNDAVKIESVAASWDALSVPKRSASLLAGVRLALFTAAFQPNAWWLATRLGAQRVGDSEASWGFSLTGLTPSQASVGLQQLSRLDEYNRQRRARALQISERLRSCDGIRLFSASIGEASYLRLPILAQDEAQREQLIERLWQAGIGVGRMYRATISELFPQLKTGRFPVAEQVARCLLTLPTHHFVTEADIGKIENIINLCTQMIGKDLGHS